MYEITTVHDTAEAETLDAARVCARTLINDAAEDGKWVEARIVISGRVVETVFKDEHGNFVSRGWRG